MGEITHKKSLRGRGDNRLHSNLKCKEIKSLWLSLLFYIHSSQRTFRGEFLHSCIWHQELVTGKSKIIYGNKTLSNTCTQQEGLKKNELASNTCCQYFPTPAKHWWKNQCSGNLFIHCILLMYSRGLQPAMILPPNPWTNS